MPSAVVPHAGICVGGRPHRNSCIYGERRRTIRTWIQIALSMIIGRSSVWARLMAIHEGSAGCDSGSVVRKIERGDKRAKCDGQSFSQRLYGSLFLRSPARPRKQVFPVCGQPKGLGETVWFALRCWQLVPRRSGLALESRSRSDAHH